MSLPTFSDASEAATQAAQSARSAGRTLIPWLPDPPNCARCDAMLYASATFDPKQAFHVTSWHCRNCDVHYPREPEYGSELLPGPRPGSERIREVMRE